MTSRVDALIGQTLQNPPSWLRALGALPSDPRRRTTWTATVALIAAYRDRYQIPEHGHPLGDPNPTDPSQRIARRRALNASRPARTTTMFRSSAAIAAPHAGQDAPSL